MNTLRIFCFALLSALALTACDGSSNRIGAGGGGGNGNGNGNGDGNGNGGDIVDPVLLEGNLFLPLTPTTKASVSGIAQQVSNWLLTAAQADSRIDLLATANIPTDANFEIILLASDIAPVNISEAVTVTGSTFSIDVEEALTLLQAAEGFPSFDSLIASRLALRISSGELSLSAPVVPDEDESLNVSPVSELLARELTDQAIASDDADNFFAQVTAEEVAAVRNTFVLAIVDAVENLNAFVDFANLEDARDNLGNAGVYDTVNQAIVVAAVEPADADVRNSLAGTYNSVRLGMSQVTLTGGGGFEHYTTLTDFIIDDTDGPLGFEIVKGEQQAIGQEFFSGGASVDFIRYELFDLSQEDDSFGGAALAGANGTLTLARDPFSERITRDGITFDEFYDAVTERAAYSDTGLIFAASRDFSRQVCVADCGTSGGLLASFGNTSLILAAPHLEAPFEPTNADGSYGVVLLQSSVFDSGYRIIAAVDLSFDASNGLASEFSFSRVGYERNAQPFAIEREFESGTAAEPIAFGSPQFAANAPFGNGGFELDLFEGETILRGMVLDSSASAFFAHTGSVCVDNGARVQCTADEDDRLPEGVDFANRIDRGNGDFEYEHTMAMGLRLPASLESLEGRYRLRGVGLNYDMARNDLIAINGGTVTFNDESVTLGPLRTEEVLRQGDTGTVLRRETPLAESTADLLLDASVSGRFSFSVPEDDGFLDVTGYVSADQKLIVMSVSGRPAEVELQDNVDDVEFGGAFILIGSRID
jgi:hypothetical protein